MLRIKLNEINPHRRSDFTRRRRISRPQAFHKSRKGFISLKKALANASAFFWLGWLDSNQRMTESKSVALPLGYTPRYMQYIKNAKHFCFALVCWGG
jgi:hypothetical protein